MVSSEMATPEDSIYIFVPIRVGLRPTVMVRETRNVSKPVFFFSTGKLMGTD